MSLVKNAAIIFLIFCAFQMNAQRGISSGRGITYSTINNNNYTTETGLLEGDTIPPLSVGDLAALYPGYTYSQLKTIREANWESFQAACQWAISNNGRVLLPPTTIEVHLAAGESVVTGVNDNLYIKGAGKSLTNMVFYPHAKLWNAIAFDIDEAGSNITLDDLSITSEKERTETYNVTLRPGGNTNQIQITSASVYSVTAANFVGKTVYASTDNITLATAYTVTNYNSGTKTLTLSTTVTAAGSDDAGIMGINFPEDTSVDSIRSYGNYWRTDNIEWDFIYGLSSTGTREDDVDQTVKFSNVNINGFDVHFFSSGTNFIVDANDSYFSGHIGSLFMYSNFLTESYIKLNNCIYEENSHAIVGYINGPFTAGNLLGSAIYSHPNIQWRITNCIFRSNNGGTTRQYSSGGGKPTPSTAVSFIENCQWYGNDEYDVLTSETMPSYYTNCSFAGAVYAHNVIQFDNCEFKGYVSSYDDYGWLKFNNCVFSSGVLISIDQRYNYLLFDGCTFTPNVSASLFDAKVDEFILRNCKFLDNANAHASGIDIFNYQYPPRFIIENCDFQDTDMYLFWRFRPNAGSFQNLNFDKVIIKGCKFAYTPFYASQFSLVGVNLEVTDCQFNSGLASSFGNYGVEPREQISKTTLTGSTINVTANNNHYYTDGTINKIATSTGVEGYYYFTSVDTTIFTEYANPGNTGSNLLFSDTIYPYQTVKLYFDATNVKSGGTSTHSGHSIGTGDGATKCFEEWNTFFSSETNPIKRGTMVLTTPSVTLTDNGNGVLTGSGGSAWIDYYRNMLVVCFDTAPTSGHNIAVTYDYHTTVHQNGMWSKID